MWPLPPFSVEGGDSCDALCRAPTLGRLFLKLLRFVGEEFTPSTTGLSARYGALFPLHAPSIDPLTLPDPFDEGNNVGRNAFRFYHVQAACREALHTLRECAAAMSAGGAAGAGGGGGGGADGVPTAGGGVGGGADHLPAVEFPLLSRIISSLAGV